MKKPNPYEGAPCIEPEAFQWARQNRVHSWDYTHPGESARAESARHTRVQRLCYSCPALTVCEEERQAILSGKIRNQWTGERIHIQGVIWAGRIHPDKEPAPDAQDALMSREDLAA